MNALVSLEYNGSPVELDQNGWFNATSAAAQYGKRPIDWLRLPETTRYLEALCRISEVRKSHFIKTCKGNSSRFTQGTWLHPKLAVRFAQWLDIDFAVWCDEQIDALLRGKDDWKQLRHEAAASQKVMNAVLLLQRQQQGKTTDAHHFSNEVRLINWALTGEFKPLDRDKLPAQELDLLAKLEERNTVLIGCGLTYDERKIALERFAASVRQPEKLEVTP
ncbi:KilA-N domain-containing protein [Methylomonas rhizoryzae]|uniref:KilA-N domain-containing protein n=1 Tax=Methylomonas rhizoryzae TaxID=2608981 RepID=UPI001231E5B5|nr:KilA-N domain-containing protein [Methylomonas rhizoryzae]